GGNDGLNTIIPYGDDRYYQLRNRIAIPEADVIQIGKVQGLHSALEPLEKLFGEGEMTILNSVGYPNPNRSHFRSMDIWHSASSADQYWDDGWLGRYLDHACTGCAQPHNAIETDDSLSLALKGKTLNGLAMRNSEALARSAHDPFLQASANHHPADPASDLGYLYKTLTGTMSSAEYLLEQVGRTPNPTGFPVNDLGRQLQLVSKLILAGAETSVFYVSMTGFDTHVRQQPAHQRLLQQYAEAVAALRNTLTAAGQWDNTLVMTFSEFGRRAEDNAGAGTDHGKANNLFLMGGDLRKPGIFNASPNLGKLDDGDLNWEIDFRRVYATILNKWLKVDDAAILGQQFDLLPLV
ncbi:MAG: DUF1501 domain-containing protein, partial [Bacteroidia bacterium]|nr:DUF1501 domain-containing protein [Bacteroidia bacterium]